VTDRENSDFDDQLARPLSRPPDTAAPDDAEPTQPPAPSPPPPVAPFSTRPQPALPPPAGYPPPQGYQGYSGSAPPPPGAQRGPLPGSYRSEPPADRPTPPRPPRPDITEWVPARENTGPPPAQWGDAPPERPTARWGDPPLSQSGAGQGNWSYVDRIRTSELIPTRKIPPRRGWRFGVYRATFGAVNPGQSPDERQQAALEAKIRSLLRGRYKIGVRGKGGVGKTTIAAAVGSIFAELRQDDRVVAIDADTAFGKLGSRIDPNVAGSYWELAADQYLHSFADVRSRVGSNSAGLFVLAGESQTARRRVLDPGVYREATSRLDNHFTISIVDCGSTMDAPITQEVLRDLDALIVVSSPWVDGASAAGQTMEWLANRGLTGLLHRTVVVINDSDGHADRRTRSVLVEQFGGRGQVVIELPYDPHLRPGGVIDIDNELNRTTRRRLIEVAAAIAEHFAATSDRPRERR
jgi:MinD-like ATPase involved in chromosome partitioning or flagellar assembly